ncbi:MAG: PilZ domain-containing protein [Desulfobacteraceae bacterium]|nr:MAG: PilZ domain-containing protein [Desulfobacteraceae bacterium]
MTPQNEIGTLNGINTQGKTRKPAVDSNQRGFKRRTAFIIVEYAVKEGVFRDIIKNIGPGGIFIGTQRAIASDQDIVLKFPLFSFEETIEVKGRIARSGSHGFAVTLDTPIETLMAKDGRFRDIVHEIDRK